MSFDDVAAAALALPEVDAHDHFDQSAYRPGGKILVTLRHGDRGTPLAVLEPPAEEIAAVTAADPATFALASSGWLVVDLERVDPDELRELLVDTWLRIAPKRLAAQHRDSLPGG